MKKIKILDYIILGLTLVLISLFSFWTYNGKRGETLLRIEMEGEVWLYPLNKDRTIYFDGYIGEMIIEIHDREVHIVDSPCKDKICIQAGTLSHNQDWAACLPNRVFITIEGDEEEEEGEIDALNF